MYSKNQNNFLDFPHPSALSVVIDSRLSKKAEINKDLLAHSDYIIIDFNALSNKTLNLLANNLSDLRKGCYKSMIFRISKKSEKIDPINVNSLLNVSHIFVDFWVMIKSKLDLKELEYIFNFARSLSSDSEIKLIIDITVSGIEELLNSDVMNSNLVRIVLLGKTRYPANGVLHYNALAEEYYVSSNLINIGRKISWSLGEKIFEKVKEVKRNRNLVQDFSITQKHSETIDYKRLYFNSIVVEYTKKCNSACRHCYISASPARDGYLAKEKIFDLIRAVEEIDVKILPFKRFCMAGGEVTLPEFIDDVIEILEFARKRNFYTEIVTNGYVFAYDEEKAKLLANAIDGLELSMSPYHIELMGREFYERVLRQMVKLRLSGKHVIIRYQTTKEDTLLKLYKTFCEKIEGFVVVSSPVSCIGRAEKSIGMDKLWLIRPEMLKGGCWRNLNITITSEGHITPCCAGSEITKYLKYGHIGEKDIKQTIRQMTDDPYLYVLTRYPEKIVQELRELLPEKVSCFCELCVLINSIPQLYFRAREFVNSLLKVVSTR